MAEHRTSERLNEMQEHMAWVSRLTRSERKSLKERVHRLDALSPRESEGYAGLRVAFLVTEAHSEECESTYCYELAYVLAKAGHRTWMVSDMPLPAWLPTNYRQYVTWIAMDQARPLRESLPPVELLVATSWTQIPELYKAGRPFIYLEEGNRLRYDNQQRLAEDGWDPFYYNLPSRVVTVDPFLHEQIRNVQGRTAVLLPMPVDLQRFYPDDRMRDEISTVVVDGSWSGGSSDSRIHYLTPEHTAVQRSDLLRQADLFIAADGAKAPRQTVLEAMACGCQVIVANGAYLAAPYVRHEENCLVTPSGDEVALAAALKRLTTDKALRDRLCDEGGKTAREWSWPMQLTAIEQALQEAALVCKQDPLRLSRPRISLCMIAKNEAERIVKCIASTYGVVDEVCLVDTGSTDDTVARAERAGARVEHHLWTNHFAESRNFSLAMATGDWILHLDADEELTPEARRGLPELVKERRHIGFLMPVDSILPGGVSRVYIARLFQRRPGVQYQGRVHENIGQWITSIGGKLQVTHLPILHHGYKEDPMRATGKRSRNRNLLLLALEESPGDPWYQYYLAAEDYLSGDPQSALNLLSTLAPHQWIEGQPATLEVMSHQIMGDWQGALQAAVAGCKRFPHAVALWVHQAMLGFALDRLDVCRAAVNRLRDAASLVGSPDLAQVTVDYLDGCMASDREVAESHWKKALRQLAGQRTFLRSLARRMGLKATMQAMRDLSLKNVEHLTPLLQALVDLQDWSGVATVLDAASGAERMPAMGNLFWVQGRTDEALYFWRQAGATGWLRYGLVAALLGERSDLTPTLEQVTPLQALALQDLQSGEESWRPAVLVSELVDMGMPDLIQAAVQRFPFLAENISCYHRLYVNP